MSGITVRNGEPYESFIRRFRRACERAGILREVKRREYFEKPSQRRKRKLAEARRKALRRAQEEESRGL
jgi:small subunit ribosomal protein S21|uniref:Small ribosomal subunit protein bS21 n=1 Tax=candidate division WOR-3 bacterium TaxID=2052148 RepID=A0A7C6EA89_UNCW3